MDRKGSKKQKEPEPVIEEEGDDDSSESVYDSGAEEYEIDEEEYDSDAQSDSDEEEESEDEERVQREKVLPACRPNHATHRQMRLSSPRNRPQNSLFALPSWPRIAKERFASRFSTTSTRLST